MKGRGIFFVSVFSLLTAFNAFAKTETFRPLQYRIISFRAMILQLRCIHRPLRIKKRSGQTFRTV